MGVGAKITGEGVTGGRARGIHEIIMSRYDVELWGEGTYCGDLEGFQSGLDLPFISGVYISRVWPGSLPIKVQTI